MVIYVVKAALMPLSATGKNLASTGITRLCGVSTYSVPDTATALPKQARYQLRYTRVLNYCVQGDGPGHRLYYTQGTQKKQSKVLTIQKNELKSMAVLCMIALR